jgi:hypothetical protein
MAPNINFLNSSKSLLNSKTAVIPSSVLAVVRELANCSKGLICLFSQYAWREVNSGLLSYSGSCTWGLPTFSKHVTAQ